MRPLSGNEESVYVELLVRGKLYSVLQRFSLELLPHEPGGGW